MKKRICLLLTAVLLLSLAGISAPAAEIGEDQIRNGDLETVASNGISVTKWTASGGKWGYETGVSLEHKRVHGGETAVKMVNAGTTKDTSITQRIKLVPGATYRASAWVYVKSLGEKTSVLYSMALYDYLYSSMSPGLSYSHKNPKLLRWEEFVWEFTAPEQPIGDADFRVRIFGEAGEVYVDDIALELLSLPKTPFEYPAKPEPIEVIPPYEFKEPAPGQSELLTNTSFEELKPDGGISGWTANGNVWNQETGCSVVEDVVHSGKYAAKITNNLDVNDGHLTQKLKLVPGAIYQASVWVNVEEMGRGKVIYSLAYWANNYKNYIGGFQPGKFQYANRKGEWVQYVVHFIAQDMGDCEVEFRVRLMSGDGAAYFDDVSLYMIEPAPKVSLEPSELFYYTELTEGFATGTLDLEIYPETAGGTVDFAIKDGDKIIEEKKDASTEGDNTARWYFDLTDLEIGKEYTLEAVLKDTKGNVLDTQTKTIQRFMPRPTALTEEGFYKEQVVGEDGTLTDKLDANGNPELLDVVIAYTRPEADADLKYLKEQGVTAFIQPAGGDVTKEKVGQQLDAAEALGLKAVVGLYPDMKPAGYPTSVDRTTYYIEKYKNHPAVLGWAVLDEPSAYFKFWELEALMEDSYKLIRSLDPVHPVYAVEATTEFLPLIADYVDILASDPYPYGGYPISGRTATYIRAASEATEFTKPVCSIVQIFESSGYFPTSMEARHFYYESLFEGATMLGYYCFRLARSNGVQLHQTEIWDDLVAWGTEGEQKDAFDYFVYRKYPTFSESTIIGADAWYASYVKDGKLYMVILNMDEKNRNAEARTVDIPLVSDGGAVTIEGFTAKLLSGEGAESITGDGSTLTVPLEQNAAVLYEITPKSDVDFSALKTSAFRDLGRHAWAAGAIRTLEEKGIVEGLTPTSYRPGYKITRGDFAMNLVRTLGLTADSTENFADVDANSRYAKEIAIGKALGIFQGQGDNKFNPDAEISRQDMMVICARGMRAAGKLSEEGDANALSAFGDSALLADYAAADMAAMVNIGIIKGNADGSLNPLGNATRAEAAVIMSRLL